MYNQLSPFTFPVDPTTTTSFPPPPAFGPMQAPQLDPAVESMLASYFPQNNSQGQGMAGPTAMPAVPDDFLSRVFSFSWESANQNNGNTGAGGGSGSGNGENGAAGNGNGAGGSGARMDAMMGQMAGMPFEGWGSGGWMA
jgi:hypothetical protein